ncbi:unnamed protein product [Brassica napus]|uniref:(rape) hypothetical protein n=1 Tax=Brassica napus TaxID=3708 RepID=A0A816IQ16_BRANA|nr:unnamed protein product [Brassica napus]
METDDVRGKQDEKEDTDHAWIYGPLAGYGKLMDHLVTSSLGGSGSARVTGPPPSETTISTIVEMGFSRSRAEEALRQVGSNSVELAMEWLFSHPEEIQEDDELSRALAMSLGNSESDTKENVVDETREQIEAEIVSLPPVEELITTCTKLLQMKEPLAFPVRDLLVLICSENNGEHRSGVISCLLSRIKDCCPVFDDTKNNLLSALLHVLALILHEDAGRGDTTADASEAGEIMLRSNHDSMTADHAENFGGSHTFVGSEDVTDDMEHDQDLDEGFAAGGDDYMQEAAEDARGLENGIGSMGIEFEMHTHVPENLDEEEDEEMSEDEEDEDDEDRVILRHDVQPAIRSRRANLSLVPSSTGREASLYSVTEVPENSGHEAEQDNPPEEQPVNRDVASSSIDPAFLDALPEGLRAEVLSAQQGVPPLVSRRVLETLTYLARNHIYVAKILLQSRLSLPSLQGSVPSDKARGKAVVVSDDHMSRTQQEPESVAFALLLSLLNQPLYLRSVAHLEQLLNLLEVIIDNAERKSESADGSDGSASEQQSTHQALEVENNSENHDMVSGTVPAGTVTKPIVSSGSSSNRAESECDVHTVLLNLPQSELCLLCSLLAREGLSDNAYTLVAEVLKKLVAIAPSHCHLFITELANAIQSLTRSAISELHMFGEAVKTLLSTTSSDGSGVLRVLQALSSLVDSLLITKEKNSRACCCVFSAIEHQFSFGTSVAGVEQLHMQN